MKITAILVAMLLVGLFAMAAVTEPVPKTKYQECMDSAKHLRSDSDTKFVQSMCNRLDVEPQDLK